MEPRARTNIIEGVKRGEENIEVLITTFIKRPYVFLFLIGFLFLGIKHLGLLRTAIWLVTGYAIAFLSEYSSIHNGFPYGEYHYIYENLQGELIVAGVPVWDSASYAFMTYAAFATARYTLPKAGLFKTWLAGGVLTMILDIITDPVAKLGKKWFLGEIYYYKHTGWYFNVPWTNFLGWLFVALAIIGVNLLITKGRENGPPDIKHLLFYAAISIFSTVIAFAIGAYPLGMTNLVITTVVITASSLVRTREQKLP